MNSCDACMQLPCKSGTLKRIQPSIYVCDKCYQQARKFKNKLRMGDYSWINIEAWRVWLSLPYRKGICEECLTFNVESYKVKEFEYGIKCFGHAMRFEYEEPTKIKFGVHIYIDWDMVSFKARRYWKTQITTP